MGIYEENKIEGLYSDKPKRELEKIAELESLKTDFFANMSHEFKTPLNVILTTVQLLLNKIDSKESIDDIEKLEQYLKGIKQNSYRILKIVNNMLDINQIDSGCYDMEIRNHNIVTIVEDVVMSAASYINENKRNIIFDTVEEEIMLSCDPIKMERIILNLLSNALKYTHENGNIEVYIDMTKEKNEVIISVKNDGDYINDDDLERIFDKFTQTERLLTRKSEGTGMGLFLVRQLVEIHDGRIFVDNNEKAGPRFVIVLPIRLRDGGDDNCTYNKKIISKMESCNIEFSDI